MPTQNKTQLKPLATVKPQPARRPAVVAAAQHHRVRTFFAALFGIAALLLIFAAFIVVWVNRTVTDTNTYVAAVAPLVSKPAIQNLIAEKASQQLLDGVPITDLASQILPPQAVAAQTPEQLTALVQPMVKRSVLQIVRTPAFAKLWASTNRTAHAQLVQQLDNGASQLSFDFTPLINGVLAQLKTTQLAPIADKLAIKPGAGVIDLHSSAAMDFHQTYTTFKRATWALVGLAVLLVVLCVVISVHHVQTLRRILLGTGIIALALAAALLAASHVQFKNSDPLVSSAVTAVFKTMTRSLELTALIVGIVCVVLAIGSKLYSHAAAKRLATRKMFAGFAQR